ncbi:TetR/AcrR family transcriptional regulator [Streptomonospora sp. PA3]|uniref:TetR family transcriptional regulator n=1 Tax=Streptomonospora sp. PA3 TaxID=2607326 RepID=UPI00130D0ABE|nr:TetR/AcrR family transcriptional regulator [Streptomonospora sp. PA3]
MGKTRTPTGETGRQTFTRSARRDQIIGVAIGLLAEHGYAGVSLSQIAERAGVTKPTVLYHFSDKADIVRAAYEHVLTALVTEVGAAVDAAEVADRPAAYVRSMIAHLSEHPLHIRTSIEALTRIGNDADPSARWRPLADLLAAARQARESGRDRRDDRTDALIIGGAIDAIVVEKLHDPDYDSAQAAEEVVGLIETRFI